MPTLQAEPWHARWGLVPSYTKPDETPDFWRMFNARSETAAERPAFQRLLQRRRCLVLAAGFYEWRKEGKAGKQPYYMHMQDDAPLVMAGLWDVWASAGQGLMHTYTILTTGGSRLGDVGRAGEACTLWGGTGPASRCGPRCMGPARAPALPCPGQEGLGGPGGRAPTLHRPQPMQTRVLGWGGCTTACR